MYCIKERVFVKFLFLQNQAESLAFKGACIQNLISAACFCRKRNQEIRFSESEKLTDRISSGSGDNDICKCEYIPELVLDIFKLAVSLCISERFVHLALSAEMDNLEVAEKFR